MSHAFCTIVAKNYLAYARTLTRSLRRHHAAVPVYVLVLDEVRGFFDPSREEFSCVALAELELPRPRELCFRYDVLELATAVKPFLLRRLFARGHDRLVYLDPDICVYRPLDDVLRLLGSWQVVLTPHRTAPVRDDKRPGEREILLAGTYNLGFLGIAGEPEARRFLDWWAERCETQCVVDPARGLFVDQRWMDLCPSLLDRVHVLRHPGYNVAYWNLDHRRLDGSADAPTANGEPLHFFHFSGFDPRNPLALSRHQDRYPRVETEPLLGMAHRYAADVLAAGHRECVRWPYTWGSFSDGHPIGREMRTLFREQPPGRFDDPFDSEGEDTFVRWATTGGRAELAPVAAKLLHTARRTVGSDRPGRWSSLLDRVLSRIAPRLRMAQPGLEPVLSDLAPLAEKLLEARPDVKATFTGPGGDLDRAGFLRWLRTEGVAHHHLKPAWCARWASDLASRGVMPLLLAAYDSRPDLQRLFPMAFLAEHDAPRFREWIEAHAAEIGLGAGEVVQMRRLFEEQPYTRIREIYSRRRDVQKAFPEALSWPGDPSFLSWLRYSARREYGIDEDSVLWFARARQQHLCVRLHRLYESRPDWQRLHPAGLLFGGSKFLAWLRESRDAQPGFDVSPLRRLCPPGLETLTPVEELRLLARSDPSLRERLSARRGRSGVEELAAWAREHGVARGDLDQAWIGRLERELRALGFEGQGVRLVGYLRTESGMGELARSTARALAGVDYPYATVVLEDAPQRRGDLSVPHRDLSREPPFTIVHVNGPEALRLRQAGPWFQGDYMIGYWAWELAGLQPDWLDAFALFDEVWTCSRHSAAAIAACSPVAVQAIWPCVPEVETPSLGREALGLDPEAFLFLFVYDLLSETERKNPLGLLRAFRSAFRRDDGVGLVIKASNGDHRPDDLARLVAAAEGLPVTILDRCLSREEVLALMNACDAYASLHRAEGFGFTLAEAMALGKPAVATHYSGNVDFMTPWNSFPVPFRLVEIPEDYGPYHRGGLWAEPDLDAAAEILRSVYRETERALEIGRRGQRDVRAQLSPRACGRRIAERLRAVAGTGAQRRGGRP